MPEFIFRVIRPNGFFFEKDSGAKCTRFGRIKGVKKKKASGFWLNSDYLSEDSLPIPFLSMKALL